jgi:hypothetical protein
MAKGGARLGAGRKPGISNRPQLRDMLSQEQIDALVAKGIEKADAGDSLMLKFILEQIFGKAPQPLTGDGGGPIQIQGVEITAAKRSSLRSPLNRLTNTVVDNVRRGRPLFRRRHVSR